MKLLGKYTSCTYTHPRIRILRTSKPFIFRSINTPPSSRHTFSASVPSGTINNFSISSSVFCFFRLARLLLLGAVAAAGAPLISTVGDHSGRRYVVVLFAPVGIFLVRTLDLFMQKLPPVLMVHYGTHYGWQAERTKVHQQGNKISHANITPLHFVPL